MASTNGPLRATTFEDGGTMSHELSFTNGRADFFELGERVTAWHKEGVALPLNTPFADALAAGNLLYPVEKQPVYRTTAPLGETDKIRQCITGAVTVRTDRDIELGVVGADYTVIQNAEAFAIVEPLVDNGTLRLETGGVLRDGADAWVLAQLNRTVLPDELQGALVEAGIAKYLLVRTNHTGRANASVTETDVRVVCANTLGMVEAGAFKTQASVQHRGDAAGRMATAFDMVLKGIVTRTESAMARYMALRTLHIDEAQWQRHVMDVVQVDPRTRVDFDPKSPMADNTVRRYDEKRDILKALWTEGRGHIGDGTAWEAYNGVAEAVDHEPDVFPVRASRVRQLLPGGRLYDLKDRVAESLLGLTPEYAERE